jgi:N-acetylglutamate synthase-like GNAT family acetyltransferase
MRSASDVVARPARVDEAAWTRDLLTDFWGGTTMAVHGELIDAARCASLVAERTGNRIGLLTYRDDGRGREIVSLLALKRGVGAGTALLCRAAGDARTAGIHRLWLVTTNDNTDALRFYQRRGFDLVALNRDAITKARTIKPAIPEISDGIPVRHEFELELRLD